MKEGFLFAVDYSLENTVGSYSYLQLALFYSVSHFLFQSPSLSLCIDEDLSIKTSANAFVFGDFNAYIKDWLSYSIRTDRPGIIELIISNNLTQMVNFPSHIPDWDFHCPALLDFFLSSGTSISSRHSDHVVASVSIEFPSNSNKRGCPFSWHSL